MSQQRPSTAVRRRTQVWLWFCFLFPLIEPDGQISRIRSFREVHHSIRVTGLFLGAWTPIGQQETFSLTFLCGLLVCWSDLGYASA
jgi:hypothetical protein